MKKPIDEHIVQEYTGTDISNDYHNDYTPETNDPDIVNSWGAYEKGFGWITQKVFTGKAVREWIQSKIDALYNKLSRFTVDTTQDYNPEGKIIVQKNKTVVIKDGNGDILCSYDTIVLDSIQAYTVNFYSNGSIIRTETIGEGQTLQLYIPTLQGYNFGGWYDNSDFTGNSIHSWTASGSTYTKNFHAKWTAVPKQKYLLTGLVPPSVPSSSWNEVNYNVQLTFEQLNNWNNWCNYANQYIVLPAISGKTQISQYMEIRDQFGGDLTEFFDIVSGASDLFIIKWTEEMLDEDNLNATVKFKN